MARVLKSSHFLTDPVRLPRLDSQGLAQGSDLDRVFSEVSVSLAKELIGKLKEGYKMVLKMDQEIVEKCNLKEISGGYPIELHPIERVAGVNDWQAFMYYNVENMESTPVGYDVRIARIINANFPVIELFHDGMSTYTPGNSRLNQEESTIRIGPILQNDPGYMAKVIRDYQEESEVEGINPYLRRLEIHPNTSKPNRIISSILTARNCLKAGQCRSINDDALCSGLTLWNSNIDTVRTPHPSLTSIMFSTNLSPLYRISTYDIMYRALIESLEFYTQSVSMWIGGGEVENPEEIDASQIDKKYSPQVRPNMDSIHAVIANMKVPEEPLEIEPINVNLTSLSSAEKFNSLVDVAGMIWLAMFMVTYDSLDNSFIPPNGTTGRYFMDVHKTNRPINIASFRAGAERSMWEIIRDGHRSGCSLCSAIVTSIKSGNSIAASIVVDLIRAGFNIMSTGFAYTELTHTTVRPHEHNPNLSLEDRIVRNRPNVCSSTYYIRYRETSTSARNSTKTFLKTKADNKGYSTDVDLACSDFAINNVVMKPIFKLMKNAIITRLYKKYGPNTYEFINNFIVRPNV